MGLAAHWRLNILRPTTRFCKAKWRHCEFTVEKDKVVAGTGDNGFFVVWLAGRVLSSVEGLKDEDEWQSLQKAVSAR